MSVHFDTTARQEQSTKSQAREGAEREVVAVPLQVIPNYKSSWFAMVEERIDFLESETDRQEKQVEFYVRQAQELMVRIDKNRERVQDLRTLLRERLACMEGRA